MYFLFTDIEGSTRMWGAYGPAMAAALGEHDRIVAEVVTRFGGRLVKHTGDGVFAAFAGDEALAAAAEIQRAIGGRGWEEVGTLKVRVAVHAGDAEERGGDYFGPEVNRAARLCEAAWGGQILLSADAARVSRLPAGTEVVNLGRHLLRDLRQLEAIYQLNVLGVSPSSFPPLRVLTARPHNLPVEVTPFVGRDEDVVAVTDLLRNPVTRLLTLTGPGGIGKTRLGLRVAAEVLEDFTGGVFFVPLAPVNSPDLVLSAIAESVRLQFYGREDPEAELINYLRGKELLLVTDNFEHVVDAAAIISRILEAAPKVKVLATSRERLHIRGEQVYVVKGMEAPDDRWEERFETYGAVALFLERAKRVNPAYDVSSADRPAIINICKLVGGAPLGIELAASWMGQLAPAEIAAEIQANLDFLETTLVDVPARHRSLRAVFDYSWNLISQEEKSALTRLAVFRGGFTRGAAGEVAEAGIAVLAALADKSLVHRDAAGRYDIHPQLRQYAAERLKELGGDGAAAAAHAQYFAAFLKARDLLWDTARLPEVIREVEADVDNIRAAWRWALANGRPDLVKSMAEGFFRLLEVNGWFEEGKRSFSLAAAWAQETRPLDRGLTASLLLRQGYFDYRMTRYPAASRVFEDVLTYAAGEGPTRDLARLHYYRAGIKLRTGEFAAARELFELSRRTFVAAGDEAGAARALAALGDVDNGAGDFRKGLALCQEALREQRRLGDIRAVSYNLITISDIYFRMGDCANAAAPAREAMAIQKQLRDRYGYALALSCLAESTMGQGELAQARDLFEESRAVFEDIVCSWGVGLACEGLSGVYQRLGDAAAAEDCGATALAAYRANGNLEGVYSVLRTLGGLAHDAGDLERARRYYQEALTTARTLTNEWAAAAVAASLGWVVWDEGDVAAADGHFTAGLVSALAAQNENAVLAALTGKAVVAIRSGSAEGRALGAYLIQRADLEAELRRRLEEVAVTSGVNYDTASDEISPVAASPADVAAEVLRRAR